MYVHLCIGVSTQAHLKVYQDVDMNVAHWDCLYFMLTASTNYVKNK